MIWPKPSCASPFNFDRVLTAERKVVHRILGPTAPPVADRSSQAASDSNAACGNRFRITTSPRVTLGS